MAPAVAAVSHPGLDVENGIVGGSHRCIVCSYCLAGLPASGTCPECGHSIANSLNRLLQCLPMSCIAEICSGLTMLQRGVLLQVLIAFLTFAMTFGVLGSVHSVMTVARFVTGLGVVSSSMFLLGSIRTTRPPPLFVDPERPARARAIIVFAASVQCVVAIMIAILANHAESIGFVLFALVQGGLAAHALFLGIAYAIGHLLYGGQMSDSAGYIILCVIAGITSVAQYIAMMRYIRWFGMRVPDARIIKQSRIDGWLLPVLSTLGVLLLGLGPLIAIVRYWNLMNRVRKHVRSILLTSRPALLPGMNR